MSLTPMAIQKMSFERKLRGYSTAEVDQFLELVAEELATVLGELESVRSERQNLEERLARTEARERDLQETLLRAQKVSEEIVDNAEREAQILVKEAELTADQIVQQSLEQAQDIERRIGELRRMRREMQISFKNALELYTEQLRADVEDEESSAVVRTLRPESGDAAGG